MASIEKPEQTSVKKKLTKVKLNCFFDRSSAGYLLFLSKIEEIRNTARFHTLSI